MFTPHHTSGSSFGESTNKKVNKSILNLYKNMSENLKKGISVIVYDENGGIYFLIMHRNSDWSGWEFPKGQMADNERIEDAFKREIIGKIGVRKLEVTHQLDVQRVFRNEDTSHVYDVFLAKANMNTPVNINKKLKYDTYIWTKEDRVLEKLSWDDEKEVFKKALEFLKSGESK